MTLEEALKKYFGFDHFRLGQEEIVQNILANKNVLGILPTGSGKTLCYALPSFLRPGLTVILSPLISLMEDQVRRLNQLKKASAVSLSSHKTPEEKTAILSHLTSFSFLLLSPEMLQNKEVQFYLKKVKIALLVIDEAHCISQWGFDFRPEYLLIEKVLPQLGFPQILALTATASKKVKRDIQHFLLKENLMLVEYPVNREKIGYLVKILPDEKSRQEDLLQVLNQRFTSGIIYCNTRKKCEELGRFLKEQGFKASSYHGGMTPMERQQLQMQFISGKLQIIVATNAFGMGIDKPDIRFVIHYELPSSLEDYVQETGRCSRDGKEGFALLYYVEQDERIHRYFAQKREENLSDVAQFLQAKQQETSYELLEKKNREKYFQEEKLMAYIFSNHCLREDIATYFSNPRPNIPEKCCSYHHLTVEDYDKGTPLTLDELKEETWEERLDSLFKK